MKLNGEQGIREEINFFSRYFKLKGSNIYETLENYSILLIFLGAIILSVGIGLTVFSTKGIPVILAMLGSFISFVAVIALVFVWLAKDFKGV